MIRITPNDKRVEDYYKAIEKSIRDNAEGFGLNYATIIGILELILHDLKHEIVE